MFNTVVHGAWLWMCGGAICHCGGVVYVACRLTSQRRGVLVSGIGLLASAPSVAAYVVKPSLVPSIVRMLALIRASVCQSTRLAGSGELTCVLGVCVCVCWVVTDLSDPVDVYAEWVDRAEAAQYEDEEDEAKS